jgi:hypothetical protein
MKKILNKQYDSLDIGILPCGGTTCSSNWSVIFGMLKDKYPDIKEIELSEIEFSAFVKGLAIELILENVKELTFRGVKIKRF